MGSGYGSNYASNTSNYKAPVATPKAGNYNTSNYISSMFKQPTTTTQPQKASGPMSVAKPAQIKTPQTLPWGTNTGIMPWGQKQPTTPSYQAPKATGLMSKPKAVGPMSLAPKPQNMSVDPNAKKYTPPPTEDAFVEKSDPSNDWMNYVQNSANRQKTFAEQQLDDKMAFLKAQGELTNNQLLEQLPVNEQNFNQYKTNTEATIADLIAGGEMQKSQTNDYYGDAQRESAKTLRETQGQQQKTFANLGSLDSGGEGSFAEANTNVMSDFNRNTQQLLKAKADKLTEIDMSVKTAERNAKATITQEEQKMRQLERDIQYAVANNDLQTAQGLKEAYAESQQYIYDIQDAVAQTQYQFGLAQQDLENEIAKMQSFTPEFMATGQPTNQAEYEYYIKNKDAMTNLYGGDGKTDSKTKAIGIIDQLLGTGTGGITGKMRFGFTDESRSAEGLLKQLSSELQLEEAKRLKGQGSMSDAERAILANSIAAFNLDKNGRPNVSDERFRQILEEMRAGFSGQPSLASILG